MKDEYKKKIDDWMANRTSEELEHSLDSATKEYLKRNKVNTEIDPNWPRLYTAEDIARKVVNKINCRWISGISGQVTNN